MSVEIGHFALIIATCLAAIQAFFGLVGAHKQSAEWMAVTRPAVSGQFVFTLFSFGCLVYAFEQSDFSVLYVASNSNSALPLFYRFTAAWGAHEGSMLLWLSVLTIWSIAVAAFSRSLPIRFVSRALGVLGVLSVGFGLFILLTSNPFERLFPPAVDGRDLNPLLQDPAFAFHPPILYMGYVGMAVPFAFAIAAILEGKLDQAWARWVRPWTTLAWIFLTCGIALGSWWAYYELGWGGWWFWDPVENSSFMPWLVATALIHSLAVTEKRGLFKSWTLLLAIFAFSLSLLGTFLTRSGVLISVHSFTSDPSRGFYILGFLTICIVGALTLYAWRAPLFKSNVGFNTVSRESFLLANNVLLIAAASLILLGTLYPLLLDAMNLAKLSVGPPYFNVVFLVPMVPLLYLLAVGMHASWKRADFSGLKRTLTILFVAAVIFSIAIPLIVFGSIGLLTIVGSIAALWIAGSALVEPISRLRNKHSLSPSIIGMSLAHFGIAMTVLGITYVKSYEVERDISLGIGATAALGQYEFHVNGFRTLEGPNYNAIEGEIIVSKGGDQIAVLHPQKRTYRVQNSPMTEAGIGSSLQRDLLASMGSELGNNTWSMRIQVKPMIRFVWLGALITAFGGMVAIFDRRYRTVRKSVAEESAAVATAK